MELVGDTAIKLRLPGLISSKILQNVNRSQALSSQLDSQELIFYWGHQETAYITSLLDEYQPSEDIPDLPSPILRDYKWPGIFKPFDHQKKTASYLSLRHRAFCFNEAGTGKTGAAIWAADYLMNLGAIKRVLVICPVSIMYSAWQADVFKTAMHRSVAVAHGDKAKREKIINGAYEFVVINYDGIGVVKEAIEKANFDLIIIDEANAYKSTSTKRWKLIAKLMTPHTRLWMMTGTPASQSPEDAFGLAKLVSPQRVPRFKTEWRDSVMTQITRFKWVPKTGSKEKVFGALQPAIRFTKRECLDLPDVLYVTRDVPMSVQAQTYYKRLKAQMRIEAVGESITAANAASAMSKLLQISGGAVYTDKRDVIEFDVGPRLQVLAETLDETSNKVVVFIPYLHTINLVADYLKQLGVTYEVINGDVPAKERFHIIGRFQSQANPRVLLIQPQSASHGVTLTAADTLVFWGPVLSVETYIQCIGRIDRLGQTSKMTVVMLQGSEIERKVYTALRGLVNNHLQLVDLYKQELEDDL